MDQRHNEELLGDVAHAQTLNDVMPLPGDSVPNGGDAPLLNRRLLGPEYLEGSQAHASYIVSLQRVILELHGCQAEHRETIHVHETFLGRVIREGSVEAFAINGAVPPLRCYAWAEQVLRQTRLYAVLESSMIKTALDAVKFAHMVASESLINEFSKVFAPGTPPPPSPD